MNRPAILYFGMFGELSRRPLAALLESGARVAAVVVPGLETDIAPESLTPPEIDLPGFDFVPMISQYLQPSAITLAWEHKIPLWSMSALGDPRALEILAGYEPELICVSCFSRIIPPAVLALPHLGSLNLHPSRLPRYRGPAPLFWQFRAGETDTAVTVHYMSEKIDAGDIVLQAAVTLPDGVDGPEAEALCAEAGAGLLAEAVDQVSRGTAPRRPQSAAEASYLPLPGRADLSLSVDWTARRAFNFVRGAGSPDSQLQFEVIAGDQSFGIVEAVSYSGDEQLGAPYRREGDVLAVQFSPGVLRARAG
jgi:methionyl-tRNA formyltransferase